MFRLSELSQSRLLGERYELEVSKLKNDLSMCKASAEALKPDAARFCSIMHTFKQVLEKDEYFCSSVNEEESFQSLSEDEICEMINYTLLESIESKQIHFADINNCLTEMAVLDDRKNNHLLVIKELTCKIKTQIEILNKNNEDQDALEKSNQKMSIELKLNTTAFQNYKKNVLELVNIIENFKKRESITQKNITKYENYIDQLFSQELNSSNKISQQEKHLEEKEATINNLKKVLEHLSKQKKESKSVISKLKEDLIAEQKTIDTYEFDFQKLESTIIKQQTSIDNLKNDVLVKGQMFTALQKSKWKVDTDFERAMSENRNKEDNLEQLKNELKCQENEHASSLELYKDKLCVLNKKVKFFKLNLGLVHK